MSEARPNKHFDATNKPEPLQPMTSLCGLYYMVVTYDWGFLVWVVLGLLFSWLYYVFYDVVYPPRFVATFSTRQTLATKTRRNQAKQYKTSTRYGFPFVHYAHSHHPQPYKIVPVIDWEWSQRRHMLRTQWSCTWNMILWSGLVKHPVWFYSNCWTINWLYTNLISGQLFGRCGLASC